MSKANGTRTRQREDERDQGSAHGAAGEQLSTAPARSAPTPGRAYPR